MDIYYSLSSFQEYYEKMADVDISPFGEHEKTDEHPDESKNIPPTLFTTVGAMRRSTWVPEGEQETSFRGGRGTSLREEVLKEHIKGLYRKLS